MNKQELKVSYAIFAAMLVAMCIIDWTCATGYALGGAISYITYWRNVRFCNVILENQAWGKKKQFSHFMNNYILMAIALLLGAFLPEYINIFAVALGLFLLKTAVIINVLIHRKESKE